MDEVLRKKRRRASTLAQVQPPEGAGRVYVDVPWKAAVPPPPKPLLFRWAFGLIRPLTVPSTLKSRSSWLQAQLFPHQVILASTPVMGLVRSLMPLEFCMSHQYWSPPSMRTLLASSATASVVRVAAVPVSPVHVAPPVAMASSAAD